MVLLSDFFLYFPSCLIFTFCFKKFMEFIFFVHFFLIVPIYSFLMNIYPFTLHVDHYYQHYYHYRISALSKCFLSKYYIKYGEYAICRNWKKNIYSKYINDYIKINVPINKTDHYFFIVII